MSEDVTLTIDDKEITVPRGTTIIEAAKKVYIDIPHYCYHPNLSVVGNCRMCQVEVEGAPKLMIACHTHVQPEMKVKTQFSSEQVAEAQSSTLELILINHPLDCTVCDQAGHCKLQDYHYEYNAKSSRFKEEKEHKPKAVSLGPTVMLDAERCIMCTRCIRFCDEVPGTSELGMINRGDRSQITINPGKELDNPFSGTVCDLCPVGALTHKSWRFNTRIWDTEQKDTICPGCSTGCNVKVAVRDGQVVHVKGRENQAVNKEWLCDEGRYGFDRFIPKNHLSEYKILGKSSTKEDLIAKVKPLLSKKLAVLLAPDLHLEDFFVLSKLEADFSINYYERELSKVQKILISPDYAANFRSAQILRLVEEDTEKEYKNLVKNIRDYEAVIFIGDKSISHNLELLNAIKDMETCALISDAESPLADNAKYLIPIKSFFQKSGLLINHNLRMQYAESLLYSKQDSAWNILNGLTSSGYKAKNDREMTIEFLDQKFPDLKISQIKDGGVDLSKLDSDFMRVSA